ncbi:MAG: hypothetical protein CMJ48_03725 [Planctomycetaceae bacterium]|nr:hypothetical protein [Planctomycetaceae bacterium]
MASRNYCDGVKRRDFLKVGALGATGLTLSSYLQMANAGGVKQKKAKAAIFVELPGGPSHMDTFDLKPDAPKEYRGEFNPIQTNVEGIEISEHLPKLAQQTDKFTILRGVMHTLAAHRLGAQYVATGNKPLPSLEFPCLGSVVTKELPSPKDLPPFVTIPRSAQSPGYLGVKYAPLATQTTPQPGVPFSVRGIQLQNGLTIPEVEKRKALLTDLDRTFEGFESDSQLLEGLDKFGQQTHAIITSKRARDAFDVSKESPAFAKPYGETPFGQSCLLATRLIESGVPFATVSFGGWDTHQDNWTRLKERQLPVLDEGLAALFGGLAEKGLLDSTQVIVTGEFGRTPKINQRVGRDHYARCMFMLMAGGGIPGGRVLGKSNENASLPEDEVGFSPDDVAASFFHNLGINHEKEYKTASGRPIMIARYGNVIEELFA